MDSRDIVRSTTVWNLEKDTLEDVRLKRGWRSQREFNLDVLQVGRLQRVRLGDFSPRAHCEMSRRDGAIVAWHEVPGTAPAQKSRPLGYGVIRAGVRTDSMIGVRKFRIRRPKKFMLYDFWLAAPDHTVPYGTVLSRDAFPGTSCQATIGVVPTGRAFRHLATTF